MEQVHHTKAIHTSAEQKQKILDLYTKAFSAAPRHETIDIDKIHDEIFHETVNLSILMKGSKVIGFISSKQITLFSDRHLVGDFPEEATYISDFVICDRHRGQGIGTKLLQGHILEMKKTGVSHIYTRSRVDIHNIVALFTKFDFKVLHTYQAVTNGIASDKHLYVHKVA